MNFKKAFRHAFALDAEEPKKEQLAFMESVCTKAREYRLTFPLMIFLEGLRPFSGVAVSVLTGLEPAAEIFFPRKAYQELTGFLENRKNIEKLIDLLSETGNNSNKEGKKDDYNI